jgi:ADP-heptose:LPS heptosyltransferase
VCNNSAPAHMAAAVGTPVVVLYALTHPQHTPWRARARVLNNDVPCRNCMKNVCARGDHACLMKVEAREVADAALDLIEMPPATLRSPVRPGSTFVSLR